MSRRKAWIPVVLVLSAVGIILVGSFPGDDRSGEPASTVSAEIPVDEPSTAPEIEFDEEGRRIFNMGEVALHFPEKYPSTSDGSSDGRVFDTCWSHGSFTEQRCESLSNVVFITVRSGSGVALPRIEDPKAYLRDATSSLDGPFESSIAGVLEFRGPLSGEAFIYAFEEIDETGRHVIARCNGGGTRCDVRINVDPRLFVTYFFNKEIVMDWPKLNIAITRLIASFIVEE